MSKNKVKFAVVMLAVVLVVVLLTGCGDKQAIDQDNNSSMAGQVFSGAGFFSGNNSSNDSQNDSRYATPTPVITPTSTYNVSSSVPETDTYGDDDGWDDYEYDDYDIGSYDYGLLDMYEPPTFAFQYRIYDAIEQETVWASIGYADNPDHIGGTNGDFYADSLDGCQIVVYFDNWNEITFCEIYSDTESYDYQALYEVMDIEYLDTYGSEDIADFRFYYGDDGFLYMCVIGGESEDYADMSDYIVFAPAS